MPSEYSLLYLWNTSSRRDQLSFNSELAEGRRIPLKQTTRKLLRNGKEGAMPEVLTETKESDLLDLDKRIALALGFKPTITWAIFNADETALMIDFERQAEARKWWDEHPSVHAEHHIGELEQYEPYSTTIEAAMRVVEKMAQNGWQIEATNPHKLHTLVTDNIRIWCVRFINDENDLNNWSDDRDSLQEAICRAALKALER